MTAERGRFPIGLTIAALIALAIMIGLGVWQLKRRDWKEDMLTRIEALQNAPAQPLAAVLARGAAGDDIEFARVTVDCPGIGGAPYQQVYALIDGKMANRLVSACPLDGAPYDGVLVDRGYVLETISSRPPVQPGHAPMQVTGVLRLGDAKPARLGKPVAAAETEASSASAQIWYGRNLGQIAAALGLHKPAPYFLMAESHTNPEWQGLTPAGLPTDIPNRHMEYALTWFALAAAMACVYAALLRRKMKGR